MNPFLKPYVSLVEFLGKVMGDNTEIVLHDVSDVEKSIIAIANGHVSNRSIGAPATSLALKLLSDPKYHNSDYLINYKGKSSGGETLKSSTCFVRDGNGKIQGLLCINSDVKQLIFVQGLLNKMIGVPSIEVEEDTTETELFPNSVEDLAIESIEQVFQANEIDPERLSVDEKIEIIRKLNNGGVFLLKAAVPKVATRLKVSEPTIYRYLTKIKNEGNV